MPACILFINMPKLCSLEAGMCFPYLPLLLTEKIADCFYSVSFHSCVLIWLAVVTLSLDQREL